MRRGYIAAAAVAVAGLASCASADVNARARATAARDLSCSEAEIRIVDSSYGLYRIRGCGIEATYECAENRATLRLRCRQIASHEWMAPDASSAPPWPDDAPDDPASAHNPSPAAGDHRGPMTR